MQDVGGPVIGGYNRIDPAIVVNITNRKTTRRPGLLKDRSRRGRYVYKSLTRVSYQQHGFAVAQVWRCQLNRIKVMPLRNEKTFPAVIVKIQEVDSPAGMRAGDLSEARSVAGVIEAAVTSVSIQGIHLIGEVGNHQIRQTIVIVVREIDSHAGERATIAIDGRVAHQRHLFEGAIALIVVERLERGIVRDKNIRMPITIIVRKRETQTLARLGDPNLPRNLGEVSVPIVVVNQGCNRLEEIRVTICSISLFVFPAPDIVEVPLQIT